MTFENLFQLPEAAVPELLPFLPKSGHALLDLSCYEPGSMESATLLRAVLQLMKLVRQRGILRFFEWLAQFPAKTIPGGADRAGTDQAP